MAGLSGKLDQIGAHMSPPMEPKELRMRLDADVMRRNQIVPEGDYRRLERPSDSRRNVLNATEARADIDFMGAARRDPQRRLAVVVAAAGARLVLTDLHARLSSALPPMARTCPQNLSPTKRSSPVVTTLNAPKRLFSSDSREAL
jgi:hypothetical protein